mmetsp:Transcript_35885/g.101615  ORF Transcript_35885/g.101615 Transcript_35885/m.101615 type:complete len:305 (+) Transcript_35885:104-1018(+)
MILRARAESRVRSVDSATARHPSRRSSRQRATASHCHSGGVACRSFAVPAEHPLTDSLPAPLRHQASRLPFITRRGLSAARGSPCLSAACMASTESEGNMFVLGLTGSIGMGKSTVSKMFREAGVPVMDSDAVVHELYGAGGGAVPVIRELFPDAIVDGGVDRKELSKYVIGNDDAMKRLEDAVHPLLEQKRIAFLQQSLREGSMLVVLDVPLLFETKMESKVDAVAVVSAGEEAQRERVLARPGMTEDKFLSILGRQVPDAEKRKRAQHIIDTGSSLEETENAVAALIFELSRKEGRVAQALQ